MTWVRAILLAGAAAALLLALRLAEGERGPPRLYVCPMHAAREPAGGPGRCAVCGMALVPAAAHRAAIPDDAIAHPTAMRIARDMSADAFASDDDRVTALVYADELAALRPGDGARFVRAGGGASVEVRRDDRPPERWDAATWRVDWRVVTPAAGVRAGEVGTLERTGAPEDVLGVPYRAVLRGEAGPYVLVVEPRPGGRRIARRDIAIGRAFLDQVIVLVGLAPDDQIIADNALLYDGERRLADAEAR